MIKMDNKVYRFKKAIWIIPAILAFLLVLIPTFNYQWPLSWDVIYHIQYAMVYAKYGFVLNDPLLNAPFGQNIGYPPLFHLLLASLAITTKIDFFQIARALQPFLAMFIVLSVSYVTRKFYGTIAGVSAGFLIISSMLLGRIILPIPENLALIFLPFSIYFYYHSLKDNQLKYALISGIIFIIIILTHQAAALILFLIITAFTIVELILNRDMCVLKNYGTFMVLPVLLIVVGFIVLLIVQPEIIYSILNNGITSTTGYITSISSNRPLNAQGYIDNLGYLVLIFAVIGMISAIIHKSKKDLLIITWILIMFLLSVAYWFGINVISYRMLIYILIPLAIIGGFGLSEIYNRLKNYKGSSNKWGALFLISMFILSTICGVFTVTNPDIASFKVKTQYSTLEIAPPSPSLVDLAGWFNQNGDKSKSILTNNLFAGTYIATVTGMPVHYGFEDFNKNITQSAFKEGKIGYIVLDKRLSLNHTNQSLNLILVKSEFYPLVYFSKNISNNLSELLPSFIKVVYENQDYIICQVEE
jgi:hypothetical protein